MVDFCSAIQREYYDFLDDTAGQGKYVDLVKKMISNKFNRLEVNIDDLRNEYPTRVDCLLNKDAIQEQSAFSRALKEFVEMLNFDYAKSHHEFLVGFCGNFGANHLSPRDVDSTHLGKLICIDAMVSDLYPIQTQFVQTIQYCEATKASMTMNHFDPTSFECTGLTSCPIKDDIGNPLDIEYGLSTFKGCQTVIIQDLPADVPTGQIMGSLRVLLAGDLIDKCKPGDHIQVVGDYRSNLDRGDYDRSGIVETVIIANNILFERQMEVSAEEVAFCRKLAKRHDIFNLLTRSFAPSIYGHDIIKSAILCLLVGGVERNLPNKMHIRGDINVLLVGDPSCGKSQLLTNAFNIASRAILTSGRGSSGVGLTAAVIRDVDGYRLQAGAMVIGDRGVVCIDEFDKMADIDRTTLHQAMEQQQISICKAGINVTLNTRTSVLAAANPVDGQYDPLQTPMENIGMQDSLLSRFDLVFLLHDVVDVDSDSIIARHVIDTHCYRNPNEIDGAVSQPSSIYNKMGEEKFIELDATVLPTYWLKKYLYIVKNICPKLSDAASNLISEEFVRMRGYLNEFDIQRTQPITPRAIEALIRLSTAHAKVRMSPYVEKKDVNFATTLLEYAYFGKTQNKIKRCADNNDDEPPEKIAK